MDIWKKFKERLIKKPEKDDSKGRPEGIVPRFPGQFTSDPLPAELAKYHAERNLEIQFKDSHTAFEKAQDTAEIKSLKESRKIESFAMDNQINTKLPYAISNFTVPQNLMLWYSSQTFIGWQLCALFSQHWLVAKCCLMPAKDACRNGYRVTSNDGEKIDPKVLDAIRRGDQRYNVMENLIEFVNFGRVFGIRICLFKVESDDPEYYYKPFNPDGITPASYKGMSQIDPYWITPQLDTYSAGDPAASRFYEPTWWNINGHLVHYTHLVIFRTDRVADLLKPFYIYGGIPIPQKIYERIYAAERTANEAPMLAITKRSNVLKTDNTQFLAQQSEATQRLQQYALYRDNYGIKTIGLDEEMQQFDTSLTDFDAVIMSQYQLVAAAANVPAVKLLGTSPKGFNATGEYEESSYHEELESIQRHDLTKVLERHHLLLIRSEIAPQFGIDPFETSIEWNPLDAITGKEEAEINLLKAQTGKTLTESGAIDGLDERNRVINDSKSGYDGIETLQPDDNIIDPYQVPDVPEVTPYLEPMNKEEELNYNDNLKPEYIEETEPVKNV